MNEAENYLNIWSLISKAIGLEKSDPQEAAQENNLTNYTEERGENQ